MGFFFFFSSRRRHTRWNCDWSSDVCSSDLDGKADAVCFTPFNKQAMRLAHPSYEDEIGFTAGVLGFKGKATEFNILEGLWNARVTSHIPLAKVSSALSVDAIVEALELTANALRAAGFEPPRIGV